MSEPARYMSWLISERRSIGPEVGRLSTTETMISPETRAGRIQPSVEMSGLSATRTGYFRISRNSEQALCARGDHVGLEELVEQVRAQDADERGEAGGADDEHRQPEMREEVEELREARQGSSTMSGE